MLAISGFKSQPAHCQNAQEMTVGKKCNVAFLATNLSDDSVRSGGHVVDRLAVRTRVSPDAPIRDLFPYLPGRYPFVVSIIPFHQIGNQFDTIPLSRQASRLQSPLERTTQDA